MKRESKKKKTSGEPSGKTWPNDQKPGTLGWIKADDLRMDDLDPSDGPIKFPEEAV